MTAATNSAPISSHPAFKWGVAGWFALLLGLGLFVMPANVHQLFAERLGIDGVLSGTPLRAALSGAAALLGFVLGLVLAIRVAAINDAQEEGAETFEPEFEEEDDFDDIWLQDADETVAPQPAVDAPRRPLNPREDIEEEGIGSPVEDDEIAPSGFEDEPEDDSALMELWREEMGDDEEAEPAPMLVEQPEGGEVSEETNWDLPEVEEDVEVVEAEAFEEEFEATTNEAIAEEPPIEEAEFEHVPEQAPIAPEHDPITPEPASEHAPDAPAPTALGDMSLDALTQRLGAALEAFKAGPAIDDNADPVIAFLRREAERDVPQTQRSEVGEDPQAELRSALDKLTRVGTPK